MERVDYRVEGGWGSLSVDSDGSIRLWRLLDREGPGGDVGVAEVISVDQGRPPLSATATLTITVTDVNDCPPHLLPPTVVHVPESSPPTLLATLTATDPDVWALGHGPPFNFSLADTNPAFIIDNINLFFNPREYFIFLFEKKTYGSVPVNRPLIKLRVLSRIYHSNSCLFAWV